MKRYVLSVERFCLKRRSKSALPWLSNCHLVCTEPGLIDSPHCGWVHWNTLSKRMSGMSGIRKSVKFSTVVYFELTVISTSFFFFWKTQQHILYADVITGVKIRASWHALVCPSAGRGWTAQPACPFLKPSLSALFNLNMIYRQAHFICLLSQ